MGLRFFLSGLVLWFGLAYGVQGWPMFQHDAKHTGRSPNIGPSASDVLWTYNTGNIISTSPSVGEDKTVYLGTLGGILYAVDSTGKKIWEFPTANNQFILSAPVVDGDRVYFGSHDKFFYSLDAHTGSQKWKNNVGDVVSGASTLRGGVLYFPAGKNLVALTTSGAQQYKFPVSGETGSSNSSPAIGDDGTAFFQNHYGSELGVIAVGITGNRKWIFPTTKGGESAPAVDRTGTVYVGNNDGNFLALNPSTGDTLWSLTIGYNIRSSPAIGSNDTMCIGSDDYKLYAIAPDGSIGWTSAPTGDKIFAAPVIDGAGNIYIGSKDSTFYSFQQDGVLRWYKKLDGPIEQAAAIGPDGTIYVGTKTGTLYAFNKKTSIAEPTQLEISLPLTLTIAPNPVSARARIEYRLPKKGEVKVEIYDATGGLVTTLFQGVQNPGIHSVTWNATPTLTGVYFCRLTTRCGTAIKKIVFVQ